MRTKVGKFILAGLLVALATMCGCAKQTDTAPSENKSNMANPWVECSEDIILEKLGFYICAPADANDVSIKMNESVGLAEITFKYGEPLLEYTYRAKKTEELEDISGLNYEWDVVDKQQVGWCDGECKRAITDTETVDVCLWYDSGIGVMYSLSTSAPDLDGFDILGMVNQFFIPIDESEIFMPSNFLEAKFERDIFESFDEIISLLDKGNGYAIVKVNGLDEEVLLITEGVYDNGDGNMASIDASVYRYSDGSVINIGNVISDGTAYPISLDKDGRIYSGGHHQVSVDVISEETKAIMSQIYAYESFDENQNVTYGGFVRENNKVYENGVEIAEGDSSVLEQCFKDYEEATPVNYTVVE